MQNLLRLRAGLPVGHPARAVLRERSFEAGLPLVRFVAARYRGRGEPLDDLYQVAALGLVKAVDGYDADRQAAFTSYAVPTIVGALSATSAIPPGGCGCRAVTIPAERALKPALVGRRRRRCGHGRCRGGGSNPHQTPQGAGPGDPFARGGRPQFTTNWGTSAMAMKRIDRPARQMAPNVAADMRVPAA